MRSLRHFTEIFGRLSVIFLFIQKKFSLSFSKKHYICKVLYGGLVPPTYWNTKRYARLVDGNLRNFRRQVSIVVRALCVGCYSRIFLQGNSQDLHQKKWYISATLLLCIIILLSRYWGGEKGCARHGFRDMKMKKIFFTFNLLVLALFAISQNVSNIVYLSNGSIIKGDIIELDKEKIKIRTTDGSVFAFDASMVDKIEKNSEVIIKEADDFEEQIEYIPAENPIKRRSVDFYVKEKKLTDDEIRMLIGGKIYNETYVGAKKQHIRGLGCVVAGFVCDAGAIALTVAMVKGRSNNVLTTSFTYITWTSAVTLHAVGFPLLIIGNSRLNWIVDSYNAGVIGRKQPNISLSVSPNVMSIPMYNNNKNGYAFGASLTLNF